MEGSNGNPFDTDDAYDGEYDNLERRCFKESIDYEESTNTSIELRDWHVIAVDKVKRASGSNQTQVLYSAYIEGLNNVRDIVGVDRLNELEDTIDILSDLSTEYRHYSNDELDMLSNARRNEIQDPFQHHGDLTERMTFVCLNSPRSEIKNSYGADAMFGGWVHRSIISIGLGSSDVLGGILTDNIEEVERGFLGMYEKSRQDVEGAVKYVITDNIAYWRENGIYQGQLELFDEVVDMMETKHKVACSEVLDVITQSAEVLEGDKYDD
jgi:hypothetical protein